MFRKVDNLLSYLQNLPNLLRHLRLWPQLEQPPREAPARLEVLQLEEEVAGRPEREHLMDWLEVAVGEVCGHLTDPLLVGDRGLRLLLSRRLHGQAGEVMHGDVAELDGFSLVLEKKRLITLLKLN